MNSELSIGIGLLLPLASGSPIIEMVKLLEGKVSENVKLLECQTVPENLTKEIKKFNLSHVLMIDAAPL